MVTGGGYHSTSNSPVRFTFCGMGCKEESANKRDTRKAAEKKEMKEKAAEEKREKAAEVNRLRETAKQSLADASAMEGALAGQSNKQKAGSGSKEGFTSRPNHSDGDGKQRDENDSGRDGEKGAKVRKGNLVGILVSSLHVESVSPEISPQTRLFPSKSLSRDLPFLRSRSETLFVGKSVVNSRIGVSSLKPPTRLPSFRV